MKPHILFLFPEDQDERNQVILPSIEELVQLGEKVETLRIKGMQERYLLPFLQAPDNLNYFGIDSIRNYIDKLKKGKENVK